VGSSHEDHVKPILGESFVPVWGRWFLLGNRVTSNAKHSTLA
jgi:hypothetical protein